MPAASTHNVDVAWLGTTRSYTFITNKGAASAIRLITKLAAMASMYSHLLRINVSRNQERARGMRLPWFTSNLCCGWAKNTLPL
ncbi:hypothetical protein D3C75_932250 [compost metagenome]